MVCANEHLMHSKSRKKKKKRNEKKIKLNKTAEYQIHNEMITRDVRCDKCWYLLGR